jgi:hypothetical protein
MGWELFISKLLPLCTDEITWNNAQLCINRRKYYKIFTEKKWTVWWNIELMAISEINKVLVSVYFVFEVQIIQTPATIIDQVVTKRYVTLNFLFCCELDNAHYDTLQPLPKTFPLDGGTS